MKQTLGYLALPLLMAAAFTTQARADGETIAVFTKNQTNPFFQTVRVGADNMAKTLNAKTLHYIPTKPDSIPEQLSQIEDVVVKKPSAIVFTPVDYKAMVPGVEKINDAKIPVVNITDRSAGGKFLSFVGADDYSLGLETARFLLKTLGGKGNIVIIEGVKGSLTNVDRVRGFNDALKENAGRQAAGLAARQLPAAAGAPGDGEPDAVATRRSTACSPPTTRWRSARSRRSTAPTARRR